MLKINLSKFTFIPLMAALLPSLAARAQVIDIQISNYGDFADGEALESLRDELDTAISAFETDINENFGGAFDDADAYMKGFANSAAVSGSGVGVDYVTPFDIFLIGAEVGAGFDPGTAGISDILSGSGDIVTQVRGAGATTGIVIGINPGVVLKDKIWFVDPKDVRLFAHFMTYSFSFNDFAFGTTSWGLQGQWKLLPTIGTGLARWNGVLVGGGLRYTSINAAFGLSDIDIDAFESEIGSAGPIDYTLNGQLSNGQADLSIDTGVFSVPLEVSTSASVLYWLGLYSGFGMDFHFGSAKGVGEADGDLELAIDASSGPTPTGPTGVITADLTDSNQSPSFLAMRVFAGLNMDFGVVGFKVGITKSLTNSTMAANLGFKGFW